MNERIFTEVQDVEILDLPRQGPIDDSDRVSKQQLDWTDSDWLSAWLILARQRSSHN